MVYIYIYIVAAVSGSNTLYQLYDGCVRKFLQRAGEKKRINH